MGVPVPAPSFRRQGWAAKGCELQCQAEWTATPSLVFWAVWPWAGTWTSLSSGFCVISRGVIIEPARRSMWESDTHAWKCLAAFNNQQPVAKLTPGYKLHESQALAVDFTRFCQLSRTWGERCSQQGYWVWSRRMLSNISGFKIFLPNDKKSYMCSSSENIEKWKEGGGNYN